MDLDYTADQIVISTGAKHSLMNVVLSLVDAGDEVILPAPYWVSYADMTNLAGGKVVTVQTGIEQDFKMTADQLRDALTERTRIVMVNSPNNPSGSVYTEEEMAAIAAVLREHPRAIAISDEIYEYINFTEAHASLASQPGMIERTVTVNGVSKGFAMTGWRIGYIAAPQWIAAACTKLQGQFTSGASGISQKATEHAMNGGGAFAAEMKAAFFKRRDFMVNGLKAIDGFEVNVPQGAFYIPGCVCPLWPEARRWCLPAGTTWQCTSSKRPTWPPSEATPSASNCIRLSYAASDEQLAEARRIERAVGEFERMSKTNTIWTALSGQSVLDGLNRRLSLRILAVGDLMVDQYLLGKVDRISPEAPVPVLNASERTAARVARPTSPESACAGMRRQHRRTRRRGRPRSTPHRPTGHGRHGHSGHPDLGHPPDHRQDPHHERRTALDARR